MESDAFSGPLSGEYDIPADERAALEMFWTHWGESAGFSYEQFSLLWSDAENQYTDELPHHNFHHAQKVYWDSMCLADLSEANGKAVDRKSLTAAALFHDAGFHRDFVRSRFGSKEEYSAAILGALSHKYGLNPESILLAQQAVRSTAIDGSPESIEDKILGKADIMNIGGDYATSFAPVTERLRQEAQEKLGRAVDRSGFKRKSIDVIARYLTRDLSLGSFDKPEWTNLAVSNWLKLIAETAREERLPLPEFVRQLGSSAVNKLLSRQLCGNIED